MKTFVNSLFLVSIIGEAFGTKYRKISNLGQEQLWFEQTKLLLFYLSCILTNMAILDFGFGT